MHFWIAINDHWFDWIVSIFSMLDWLAISKEKHKNWRWKREFLTRRPSFSLCCVCRYVIILVLWLCDCWLCIYFVISCRKTPANSAVIGFPSMHSTSMPARNTKCSLLTKNRKKKMWWYLLTLWFHTILDISFFSNGALRSWDIHHTAVGCLWEGSNG